MTIPTEFQKSRQKSKNSQGHLELPTQVIESNSLEKSTCFYIYTACKKKATRGNKLRTSFASCSVAEGYFMLMRSICFISKTYFKAQNTYIHLYMEMHKQKILPKENFGLIYVLFTA